MKKKSFNFKNAKEVFFQNKRQKYIFFKDKYVWPYHQVTSYETRNGFTQVEASTFNPEFMGSKTFTFGTEDDYGQPFLMNIKRNQSNEVIITPPAIGTTEIPAWSRAQGSSTTGKDKKRYYEITDDARFFI